VYEESPKDGLMCLHRMKNIYKRSLSSPFNLALVFSAVLIISTLIFIRRWLPINTLVAYFDDGLFLSRAEFILSGQLGEVNWGFNALVKGTFYPWFIVFGNKVNLNPVFLSYLVLVLIVLLLGLIIYSLTKNILLSLGLILFISADPVYFSEGASRMMREFTHQNSVLLFFVCFNVIFYFLGRSKASYYLLFSLSVVSGLVLTVSINVREENIWIYSAYVVNIIILFLSKKFTTKQILYVNIIITVTLFLSIQIVRSINNYFYDVRLQNSSTEGQFPKMLLNLSSIETSKGNVRYSAIDKSKREIAYNVSPSFAQLQPYLEGPGQAWIQFGCQDSNTCDDYSNGWFHVALREGMRNIGWWDSEKIAQEKMLQINNEIAKSCEEKLIKCRKGIAFGPLNGNQFISQKEIADSFPFFFQYVKSSLDNWGIQREVNESTIFKTEIMPEDLYTSWKKTIPSMPDGQNQYLDKYNSRYLTLQPFLNYWSSIYTLLLITLLIFNILNLFLLIFYKFRIKLNFFLISTYLIFMYLWVSRGIFLSLNSSVNIKSVILTYSLSGRVFLSGFLFLGLIIFFSILKQRSTLSRTYSK
jgi:hypothetical protein